MKKVTIVLVTYNRSGFLKKCLSSLYANTTYENYEVLIWNNNSDDDTREIIEMFEKMDSRFQGIHYPKNVFQSGYGLALKDRELSDFILELDDDVIMLPYGWLTKMVEAFERVPYLGYLAANVIQDDQTNGAKADAHFYAEKDYGNGVVLEFGPTGGWCTMTAGSIYQEVGGFISEEMDHYFLEDADYRGKVARKGYLFGILKNVQVYHATGLAPNSKFKQGKDRKTGEDLILSDGGDFDRALSQYLSREDAIYVLYQILSKYQLFLNLYEETGEYIQGLLKNQLHEEAAIQMRGFLSNGVYISKRFFMLLNVFTRLHALSPEKTNHFLEKLMQFVTVLSQAGSFHDKVDVVEMQKYIFAISFQTKECLSWVCSELLSTLSDEQVYTPS